MDVKRNRFPHTSIATASSHLDGCDADLSQAWGFIHQQAVIMSFLTQMEIFDPALLKQCRSVAHYTVLMAQSLEFAPEEENKLLNSSLLYDLGMIGIDRRIREKRGNLTPQEWEIIRAHPLNGVKILSHFPFFCEILPVVMHHHEWYDGTGYPDSLMGEDIPLLSRIIMIVDAFVALTTDRPYRAALTINKALDVIRYNKGRQFDPKLIYPFIKVVSEDFYRRY